MIEGFGFKFLFGSQEEFGEYVRMNWRVMNLCILCEVVRSGW